MGFFLLLCLATAGVLFALGVVAVRAVLWLVFLPFRLLFGVLLIPFWIGRAALKLVGFVVMLPIVAVLGAVALLGLLAAAVVAVLVPLAPVLLVGGLLYLVFRLVSRRPAVAA
jgi:hypothetical protein